MKGVLQKAWKALTGAPPKVCSEDESKVCLGMAVRMTVSLDLMVLPVLMVFRKPDELQSYSAYGRETDSQQDEPKKVSYLTI